MTGAPGAARHRASLHQKISTPQLRGEAGRTMVECRASGSSRSPTGPSISSCLGCPVEVPTSGMMGSILRKQVQHSAALQEIDNDEDSHLPLR
jgi:hypothetical protein